MTGTVNPPDSDVQKRKVLTVPIDQKDALTLPEAAALGYGSVRSLRQMVSTGRLKRCVLRVGARGVRLHRDRLIDELAEG